MKRYKKCITCNGEGKLTKTCQHCSSPHTCQCPDCKGSGKLPFEELILCEKCGVKFRCPLTDKKKCRNWYKNGYTRIRTSPYKFIIKDSTLIRQCFCSDCTSTSEWKYCDTQVIEKPKEKHPKCFETTVMRERANEEHSKTKDDWQYKDVFGNDSRDF